MRISRLILSLLITVGLLAAPVQSRAQIAVGISVRVGPPVLPVYVQPICPGPGFMWVPGYWAYGPDGYFWVPGTWVEPPEVGVLWTPGYWGWDDDFYIWHAGYWGPEVGFYGGINYGFGYTGVGFFGGYWRGGNYYYNRSVTNVDVTAVHNTYNTTVINNNTTINRVSFNGGRGGTNARPTSQEMAAAHERHIAMTSEQTHHQQAAGTNRTLLASVNHGRPDVAASTRPGQFNSGRGALESGRSTAPNRPSENSRVTNRSESPSSNGGRANVDRADRPPSSRSSSSPPVNPGMEQKHQQQFDRLHQQQTQERQRVEQKHQQEQQKLQQHPADVRKQQDVQRKQQQQVQQLDRKHEQQQQQLQQRQQQEQQRQQKPAARPPSSSKQNEKAPPA